MFKNTGVAVDIITLSIKEIVSDPLILFHQITIRLAMALFRQRITFTFEKNIRRMHSKVIVNFRQVC